MKKDFIIAAIAFVILILLFGGGQFFVPAVKVDGSALSYRSFYKDRDGLVKFRDSSGGEFISDEDIEKGVISAFIEDALVRSELSARGISENEVENFIRENVTEAELSGLEAATSRLYGWSVDDFKKFVLLPQARGIILVSEFEKENTDPDIWLENSRREANISIYLPRWKWEEEIKNRY